MNFLKRSVLAVTRRKSRSVILLLILALMSTFLLASLAIVEAAHQSTLLAREHLGNYATLTFDYKRTVEQSLSQSLYIPDQTSIIAYEEEALILANHSSVNNYNFIINTYGRAHDFNPIGVLPTEGQHSSSPDLVVVGVTDSSLLSITDGDAISLVDGKHVNQPGEVIVEEKLAALNNLKIGDQITVAQFNGFEQSTLEVVGIYKNQETSLLDLSQLVQYSPIVDVSNRLYVHYSDAKILKPDSMHTELGAIRVPSAGVDRVIYYIDQAENVEPFVAQARSMPFAWDEIRIDANDRAYNIMVEPLVKVHALARKIIFGTAIIGAIILSLILMLWVKERSYETGVLLSLGEEKYKVVGQFVTEVLIIAVVAFGVSTLGGNLIAQNTADKLMDRQIQTESSEHQETTVRDIVNTGLANSSRLRRVVGASGETWEPIDHISVRVQTQDILKMMGVAFIVIILSILLPAGHIMRYNPKTILTKTQ